jgi:hypothetical protein
VNQQHALWPNRPKWIGRIAWLWDQDDVCWRDDPPERAWLELFGTTLPRSVRAWLASYDAGDSFYFLDEQGHVYVCSYPGNCSIGVLKGPGVAL